MTKRFKLYDEETLDTHIEDNEDCYSDGTPKSYWFGENEDFCNLFYKLNELSDENEELKRKMEKVYNSLVDENEQLKKELKRCKDWINSDKNDYELTLAFIKNKGYSLKDVIEYEKELKE